MTISLFLPHEKATKALAKHLAPHLDVGDIVALYGTLGMGKSAFSRALIQAKTSPSQEVPSPTFTLVQIYEPLVGPSIWHFDLYRIEDSGEALELDIEDAFSTGISVIEWPERLGPFLPLNHLRIELKAGPQENERWVEITYSGTNSKLQMALEELKGMSFNTPGDT